MCHRVAQSYYIRKLYHLQAAARACVYVRLCVSVCVNATTSISRVCARLRVSAMSRRLLFVFFLSDRIFRAGPADGNRYRGAV